MSYPTPSPRKGSLPGQRGYPTLRPASPGEAVTFFRGSSPQRVTTAKQAI